VQKPPSASASPAAKKIASTTYAARLNPAWISRALVSATAPASVSAPRRGAGARPSRNAPRRLPMVRLYRALNGFSFGNRALHPQKGAQGREDGSGLEHDSGDDPDEDDFGLKHKRRILERADRGSRVLEPLLKNKIALGRIPSVRGRDTFRNPSGAKLRCNLACDDRLTSFHSVLHFILLLCRRILTDQRRAHTSGRPFRTPRRYRPCTSEKSPKTLLSP
jgi:hypothetical protein